MTQFKIIGCPKWGARHPLRGLDSIVWTPGRARRVIFHHTAGHHPEIRDPKTESYSEGVRYALDIQHSHQTPSPTDPSKPWNDSGHNFLVLRNGMIFQGRWRTVMSIQSQRMVVSAHCPGQNDQIGIEHEHFGQEEMPLIQKQASAWLQSWIARQYGLVTALDVYPHNKFFNTNCPANLESDIGTIHWMANRLLRQL